MRASPRVCDRARWSWLGRVPFAFTAQLQESLRDQVLGGQCPNTLLLCEHDPVITLGRSAQPLHVLADPETLAQHGVALAHASRGGDVTYHGPGQLVGYPVFRLRAGVVAHVTWMAAAVVQALATYGIEATFRRDQPGVWVGPAKICAFGVHIRHRVAIHGFALNVAPQMDHFKLIVPCGLHGQPVTSLSAVLDSRTITTQSVIPALLAALAAGAGEMPFEQVSAVQLALSD